MVPGNGNYGRKFGQGEGKKIPCFRCLILRFIGEKEEGRDGAMQMIQEYLF
jgi:hypothetical protein